MKIFNGVKYFEIKDVLEVFQETQKLFDSVVIYPDSKIKVILTEESYIKVGIKSFKDLLLNTLDKEIAINLTKINDLVLSLSFPASTLMNVDIYRKMSSNNQISMKEHKMFENYLFNFGILLFSSGFLQK